MSSVTEASASNQKTGRKTSGRSWKKVPMLVLGLSWMMICSRIRTSVGIEVPFCSEMLELCSSGSGLRLPRVDSCWLPLTTAICTVPQLYVLYHSYMYCTVPHYTTHYIVPHYHTLPHLAQTVPGRRCQHQGSEARRRMFSVLCRHLYIR